MVILFFIIIACVLIIPTKSGYDCFKVENNLLCLISAVCKMIQWFYFFIWMSNISFE